MIGTLTRWPAGGRLIQGLGVVIAALGCYFLAQSLGAVA
jgi:urease accessory protein